MTPTGIDLKVVRDRLAILDACLAELRALPAADGNVFAGDHRNPAAAESFLRRAIEAVFDTARHLLAKGLGIGGLEYREVARLAAEHGLITAPALAAVFLSIAGFRNRLAHFYDEVTPEELLKVIRSELGDLEAIGVELQRAASRLAAPPPT